MPLTSSIRSATHRPARRHAGAPGSRWGSARVLGEVAELTKKASSIARTCCRRTAVAILRWCRARSAPTARPASPAPDRRPRDRLRQVGRHERAHVGQPRRRPRRRRPSTCSGAGTSRRSRTPEVPVGQQVELGRGRVREAVGGEQGQVDGVGRGGVPDAVVDQAVPDGSGAVVRAGRLDVRVQPRRPGAVEVGQVEGPHFQSRCPELDCSPAHRARRAPARRRCSRR